MTHQTTMPGYLIHTPRDIVFGCGKAASLAAYLPESVRRVLLITGKHAASSSALEIRDALTSSGRTVEIFSDTMPEPPPSLVDAAADAVRGFRADAVAALGGGSVIDTAKAAAALAPLDGRCLDYFNGLLELCVKSRPFFAALPTTSGTGAEMTNNSVLTEPSTRIKKSIRHAGMTADLAVVDPLLTTGCPAGTTIASGLDAFVQAVEAYVSPKGTAYTRALAMAAAEKLFHALPAAAQYSAPNGEFKSEPPLTFRSDMAEGSMLAGLAFAHAGLGAVHGLAHPIGSLLRVPHGMACAILLLPVFQFNLTVCGRRYGELAKVLLASPDADAARFYDAVRELVNSLGVPSNLRAFGLTEEHFPFIVENCRSNSMKNNPAPMSDAGVESLLRGLL